MNQINDKYISKFTRELQKQIESCVKYNKYLPDEYDTTYIEETFCSEEVLYKVMEVLKKYKVV